MNAKDARKIVEANIKQMMWDLQINMWQVDVLYTMPAGVEENTYGQANMLIDYKKATISLRASTFKTYTEVLDCLLHELFHIVLAEFDLHHDVALQMTRNNHEQESLRRVWAHTVERGVWGLETMFKHGIGYVYPCDRQT